MQSFSLIGRLFLGLIFLFTSSLEAQLNTNAFWPMFHQNAYHTGQTNLDVSGPQKNPFILWSFTLGGNVFDSSPAVADDGTVYIGASDGKLYAVKNGSLLWSYQTGGDIYCSPSIGKKDKVYIGSTDNRIHVVSNGLCLWSFKTNSSFNSSPAIGDDGTVYIGNNNGFLYALTNGAVKWACDLGSVIEGSSPALSIDGTVYIGTLNDRLYAVTNGSVKWFYNVGSDIRSSPAIGQDGTVYVTTYEGLLYAFTDTGSSAVLKWPAFDSLSGQGCYSSPAVDNNDVVYFGIDEMDTLYAITNGAVKWSYVSWGAIYSSPVIGNNGFIYYGGYEGNVVAVTNGTEVWSLYADLYINRSTPALGDDGVLYIGANNKLYAIRQENLPLLSFSSNSGFSNTYVSPQTNANGSFFNFEVKYSDLDNDYPVIHELWIDLNDNGSFDMNEKYSMISNSGISYSNGVVYQYSIQAFMQGDGILNYTFCFVNQHGFTNDPYTNNITVTNSSGAHTLTVSINDQQVNSFDSFVRQAVLAVQIWDSDGDTLQGLKVGNTGDMTASSHIDKMELWYDQNANYTWDTSDVYVADLNWNGTDLWTNNNISFATTLSYPDFNYICTIDLRTNNIKESNTFKAYIPSNGITCSGAFNTPSSPITNKGMSIVNQFIQKAVLSPGLYYSSLALNDIDNDDDLDIVFIGNDGGVNHLKRYINNGAGYFTGPVMFGTRVSAGSIALGDIDKDGDSDLIVAGEDDGSALVLHRYRNNGGVFTGPDDIGTGHGMKNGEIALEDINNDGALDIVLAGFDEDVVWYMNDGTGDFSGPLKIYEDLASSSLALGDVNNDGSVDLVVAGSLEGDEKLLVFFNNGSGDLSTVVNVGVGLSSCSIALGDINEDGFLDLITTGLASGGENRLDLYLNNGTGSFGPPQILETPVGYSSIALGDINNDGKIDLLVSGEAEDGSLVLDYYENQSAQLIKKPFPGTGVKNGSIALGDINKNGSLDLLVTGDSVSGPIFYSYQNMERTTNQDPSVPNGLSAVDNNGFWKLFWNNSTDDHSDQKLLQYHVAIGYLSSGDYNLISTNIDYPRAQVSVGNIPLSQSNLYQTRIPVYNSIYYKVCALDTSFKKSQYSAEFSFVTNADHAILVRTNKNHSGTNLISINFPVMSINIQDTSNHALQNMKVGNTGTMVDTSDISEIKIWHDVNLNHIWDDNDIYITNLSWNGTGWSNYNINHPIGISGLDILITADIASSIDVTRDFRAYIPAGGIQCSGGTNGPVNSLTNQDSVWYKKSFNGPYPNIWGYRASSMALGDINEDGWLDFLANGQSGGSAAAAKRFHYVRNNQAGSFIVTSSPSTGHDCGCVVVGDLDIDGHLDVIYSGWRTFSLIYFHRRLGNGVGGFGGASQVGTPLIYNSLALGDLDGDGDLDLINSAGGRLEIYYGLGNGNFMSVQSFGVPVSAGPQSTALGDMDNDGDLDLIVTGSSRMDFYENRGDGTFEPALPFGNGTSGGSLALGDLNNDGWLDIVSSGSAGLYRYINNRDGSFSGVTLNSGNHANVNGLIGDLDNDGDLDLTVNSGNRSGIYYNKGDGNFTGYYAFGSTISGVGYTASSLGDIDNDGDLDLLVSGASGSTFIGQVYYNEHDDFVNTAPNAPVNLSAQRNGYYWQFNWEPNPLLDDHTSDKMLRYHIAIGTGPDNYDIVSPAINYPKHQANLGNVTMVTACQYQSRIMIDQTVYWRVWAIDTSFKISSASVEMKAEPIGNGPFYVSINGNDFSNPGTFQRPFRTIQKAVNEMSKGGLDVWLPWTYVFPGTYYEQVNVISNGNNNMYMRLLALSNRAPVMDGAGTNAYALDINNAVEMRVSGFHIKNYTDYALKLSGQITNSIIKKCRIYSNQRHGIILEDDISDKHAVYSNYIFDNDGIGIYMNNGDNHEIYRNLIYNNPTNISINGTATNIDLINNTIAKARIGDGVLWQDTSKGYMYNNCLLSNNGYAVSVSMSSNVLANFNLFYGNNLGITNGIMIYGRWNITNNPLLDTVSTFTITSRDSWAVDSATNIPDISDDYLSLGPDIGYWESPFTRVHTGPFFVDVTNGRDVYPGSWDAPFRTIQRAASRIGTGTEVTSSTCYILPGVYREFIPITQNNNSTYMVFTPYGTNYRPVITGGGSISYGFDIDNANKIMLTGLELQNYATCPVYIYNVSSRSNVIKNCLIHDNNRGPYFYGNNVRNIFIFSNEFYNNNFYGIYTRYSDNFWIYRNLIRNSSYGIYSRDAGNNIDIINNTIYGNTTAGIYFNNNVSSDIINNIIMNSPTGISYNGAGVNKSTYVDYNVFFANSVNSSAVSQITQGSNNYYSNPFIETVSTFTITSPASSAVDHGLIITNISHVYNEDGPDIGWKESSYTNLDMPPYVHILPPMNMWLHSINNAANTATNNCIIECYVHPLTFTERVVITDRSNLVIRAVDWISNLDSTTTIIDASGYDRAITIDDSKNIVIEGFTIKNAINDGIYFEDSYSNRIANNHICSNGQYGVSISDEESDNNTIISNKIFQNAVDGIYNYRADNTLIARNVIYQNVRYGIQQYYGYYIFIINNTLFKNGSHGIYHYRYRSYATNNIILSNQGYAIYNGNTTGYPIIANYNVYWGNGNTTYRVTSGLNNYTADPLIDTVTSFTIISAYSPCVDNGETVTNVSDNYFGEGPDIGWHESDFEKLEYVHILPPMDVWTNTINNALSVATNNCSIACYANPIYFRENVIVNNKTNLIIYTHDWTNSRDNSTTSIYGYDTGDGVTIQNSKDITIRGFSVHNFNRGIFINNTISNKIVNNRVYNNNARGVYIYGDGADYNYVMSNYLYGPNQDYGVHVYDGDNNMIYSNRIYRNDTMGCYLQNTPVYNMIVQNKVYSNSGYGISIQVENADNNQVRTNQIYNNTTGIYVTRGDNNLLVRNTIYNNSDHGIYAYNSITSLNIINNTIFNNDDYGIYCRSATVDMYNNIIAANGGLGIRDWSATTTAGYNLFYGNSSPWDSLNNDLGNFTGSPPYIEYQYPFAITNTNSLCIDNGSDFPGITDNRQGYGPDIGWLESPFSSTRYVHILSPMNVWTNQIAGAVLRATNNCIIECYQKPLPFNEGIIITGKTNLIIRSYEWNMNRDNTAVIINGAGYNNVFDIDTSKHITIEGFSLYNADQNGIRMDNAQSNLIQYNRIYNNGNYGIILWSSNPDYNTIFSNEIANLGGTRQNDGIRIYDAAYNRIYKNRIHHHADYGIFFNAGNWGQNNFIVDNEICSNADYGIIIDSDNADNNQIKTNRIYRNSSGGVYINRGDNNQIIRNVIYNNPGFGGVVFQNTAENSDVYNNTIFKNGNYGIYANGGSVDVYNNIILSNANNGIRDQGSTVNACNNLFYGNGSPWNSLDLNVNNITGFDPLMNFAYPFQLVSPYGLAVDSASNLPEVTDSWFGGRPDRGWLESPFTAGIYSGPYFVFPDGNDSNLGAFTNPFRTIQKAVDSMSIGFPYCTSSSTYIAPGIYAEKVIIRSNNNTGFMVITQLSNQYPILNGYYTNHSGFFITNTGLIHIRHIQITAYTNAVFCTGDVSNVLLCQNNIVSNDNSGIFLDIDKGNINIYTNTIWGLNQDYGILINKGNSINIISNLIYNNQVYGVYLNNSTNSVLSYNQIFLNPGGILYNNSDSSVKLNNFLNNEYGFIFSAGTWEKINKNNYFSNGVSFSNNSGLSMKITNNWWNTIMLSDIKTQIRGVMNNSNIIPYRLLNAFDTRLGADTDPPERIQNFSLSELNGVITLNWDRCNTPDFTHYRIYRSFYPGNTNLNSTYVITNIFDADVLTIDDRPGPGSWYYTITALDDPVNALVPDNTLTNECWYADVQGIAFGLGRIMTLAKEITNLSLNSVNSPAYPGSTITYKLTYTNYSTIDCQYVVIYDRIPSSVTFSTAWLGTATGWTLEFSTNFSPVRSYNSSSFSNGYTTNESVKWIRWKKSAVTPSEDGLSLFYRVIIK